MSTIVPVPSGLYENVLNAFFSTESYATLQASSLWAQYLTSIGKPLNYDPTTDVTLTPAEVAQFEQNFVTYSLTYQQSSLWQQFLSIVGKPPDYDPNTDATLTGAALAIFQNQFMQFVRETLSGQQNQVINQQSPQQVMQNQLMLTTFEDLLAMLNTMSDSVGVVANNLVMLGNWQNAYTQMLSKVPTYVGGTSSQVVVPTQGVTSGDLNLLTFGYGNISGQDIANWAANALQGTSNTSFQMNLNTNSSSQIYNTFQTLDNLTGQSVNTGTMSQISNNSYFKITVDPTNQTVTFSVSGVNLEQFAGANSTNSPTFGTYNNFAMYETTSSSGNVLPITIVTPGQSTTGANSGGKAAPPFTAGVGTVYQKGGISTSTIPTDAYAVVTNASGPITISDPSNFNNAASSIEGAFSQFWNSSQTQAISNFKNITGVRLAITRAWVYSSALDAGVDDPTNEAIPNWESSGGDAGLDNVDVSSSSYFSDYTLDGATFSNIAQFTSSHEFIGGNPGSVTLPNAPSGELLPSVPWTRTFTSNSTDSATELESNNAASARAEENAQLQTYIENIRGLRQVVQNEASSVQSNLSNIQNAISQQGTLMDSIIQSLESITTAIFR